MSKVELRRSMGDDLVIVNEGARISYDKESKELTDKDIGLLRYLIKHRDGSPFEHVVFTFHVECPIYVARQWFRHRWSSFNEKSLRYTIEDNYELPDRLKKLSGKQGDYRYECIPDDISEKLLHEMDIQNGSAFSLYHDLIDKGIAKEQARMVLPLSTMTKFTWTVNLRALFNFLSLRTQPEAQEEIRILAFEVEKLAEEVVPHTMKIWKDMDRPAI